MKIIFKEIVHKPFHVNAYGAGGVMRSTSPFNLGLHKRHCGGGVDGAGC
jgi:hypothetical protein